MIHGLIYNLQRLGTWGEYFLLNLFPKSSEFPPTSPKKHQEIQDECEKWGQVDLLVSSPEDR